MAERPNVLLIVVDACRADHVAPYGERAETPAVASLAAEGTVYRRAISPAPWTLPSVTSLLTGRYPHEHGATSRGFATDAPTLVDDLSAAGYRCIHVSPTTWIGDWLPQGRGFDGVEEFTGPTHRRFDGGADVRDLSEGVARGPEWYATVVRRALASDSPLRSLGNAAAYKLSEATGDAWLDDVRASETAARTVDELLGELADGDAPFFAYVHLMDPHLPWYVPTEFESDVRPPGRDSREEERRYVDELVDDLWAVRVGERTLSADERGFLRARYADAVEYADRAVGRMLESLAGHGLGDDTLVAFTADHGEHLGERVGGRTMLDHQQSVRLPVLRVPLVVRLPGRFAATESDELVQPHYLAPTVRELAGLEGYPSRSLLVGDDERRSTALAEYDGVVASHPPAGYRTDECFRRRVAAVEGEWKLDVVGDHRRAARIDWEADETHEVDPEAVPDDVRESLEAALSAATDRDRPGAGGRREVPEGVGRRLADLGYR
ncbi:sulfatase [Halorarum salinum]|uniref:Sulfatase n=1 Tax=Halorarum salinum TaxID=2743089 RepID=A0A7D5QF62_9EURY|nr:sulfatase [Halobaculum salinum]QLG60424.1 sulfatase [Halobaculum salinum]